MQQSPETNAKDVQAFKDNFKLFNEAVNKSATALIGNKEMHDNSTLQYNELVILRNNVGTSLRGLKECQRILLQQQQAAQAPQAAQGLLQLQQAAQAAQAAQALLQLQQAAQAQQAQQQQQQQQQAAEYVRTVKKRRV